MTTALCLNCGATKFGALCDCGECGAGATGDWLLDVTFSDHNMSVTTLRAFGEVVRSIQCVCDDDQLRFWSFIYFVSTRHPDILACRLPPEQIERLEDLLLRASPPAVVVTRSRQSNARQRLR